MTARRNDPGLIAWLVILILAIGLVCVLVNAAARAHSWYSPACCSDKDCAPIPAGTRVVAVPLGYEVHLPGGERVFFAKDKVQPSQDGEIHACIGITLRTPYCLYMPAGA